VLLLHPKFADIMQQHINQKSHYNPITSVCIKNTALQASSPYLL